MQTRYLKTCAKIYFFIYHESSIKPPGGPIFFQALFGVGGGGLKERGAYLI